MDRDAHHAILRNLGTECGGGASADLEEYTYILQQKIQLAFAMRCTKELVFYPRTRTAGVESVPPETQIAQLLAFGTMLHRLWERDKHSNYAQHVLVRRAYLTMTHSHGSTKLSEACHHMYTPQGVEEFSPCSQVASVTTYLGSGVQTRSHEDESLVTSLSARGQLQRDAPEPVKQLPDTASPKLTTLEPLAFRMDFKWHSKSCLKPYLKRAFFSGRCVRNPTFSWTGLPTLLPQQTHLQGSLGSSALT